MKYYKVKSKYNKINDTEISLYKIAYEDFNKIEYEVFENNTRKLTTSSLSKALDYYYSMYEKLTK